MKNVRRSVILILLKKETGKNPVRARRRKAQGAVFLLTRRSVRTSHWETEKVENGVPQSEYFLS